MGWEFLMMMLQTFLALAVVCGLAYLMFRVVLPRVNLNYSTNSMVRIVDKVTVDARKSLCVIEVAGKWMLIGITENGIEQICELDATSAKIAEEEIAKAKEQQTAVVIGNGFVDRLSQLMNKNQGGKK